MSKTDYAENRVIDHMTGKAAWAAPIMHIALFTAAPSDAGGGTEVTGGAYARAATTAATWNAATAGSATNAAAITFPTATAAWGTITHVGFMDAATAGNMMRWAPLTASKAIGTGDSFSFPAGSITITED